MSSTKSIWIDLDNSPHVPLFVPIVRHYREMGIEVIFTARDHSQTIELLDLHGLTNTYAVIGKHSGGGKLGKITGTLNRARQLLAHIRGTRANERIAVAISHGSRAMVLAARWLRIPVVTMYDYEFTETGIFNRFSTKVLVPDRIPDATLDEIGLPSSKRTKYPGIKEELYVTGFTATQGFREELYERFPHVPTNPILAVIRPPATTANYHSDKSEVLLQDVLTLLVNAESVFTLIVPRTSDQARSINALIADRPNAKGKTSVIDTAVDGLNLAYAADLVISGGGTMNREAALLGVPVYSIFAGRQGALDRQMESEGLITFIRDARDLSKIRLERRKPHAVEPLTDRVKTFVVQEVDSFLGKDGDD